MNIITPPVRAYETPAAEMIPLMAEKSFCQSNIKDYPNNPIIEEEDDNNN